MASTLLITVANFETTITTALTPSSTSLTLSSNVDSDGNTLPDGKIGLTINEGKTNEEHVIGTKVGTAVSSLTRNVSRIDGTTAQTGKSHRKGSPIKITNHPLLVRIRRILDGTDSFDGSNPMRYDSNPTWTSGSNQLATVKYIDDKAIAGSPDASTTAKGLAEEATQAEIDANTGAGSAARLFVNPSTLAASKYGTRLPTANEKAAITGNSGTAVSASNKLEDAADASAVGVANKLVRSDANGKIAVTNFNFLDLFMGPLPATYVKLYHTFKIPMIGTSAAAVAGAWVAGSADVVFDADTAQVGATGAERAYKAAVFPYLDATGDTSIRFSKNNIIVMDFWAILPTSSIDCMLGFVDAASSLTITYNQTAQEAICFTTNNGNLYGHVSTGSASTTTAIAAITVSTLHNYRIVADLGGDTVDFYVDGVLKLTIATNFPTSNQIVQAILGVSANGTAYVTNPQFALEMNP